MEYKIKPHNYKNNNKEKVLRYIQEYINNIPINTTFKEQILDFYFISNNPGYYIDYPFLFANAFEVEDEIILFQLSTAGFLYYKSTILLDRILDSNTSINKTLPLVTICQEECVKILSSIFHLHSEYWELWNKRKEEFFNAFIIDYKTHAIYSYEDYENLADWKSALGKLAIDALYLLSSRKDENIYKKALLAHKYFYCAFQAMDDILDFREDIDSKQFNIGYWALKKV